MNPSIYCNACEDFVDRKKWNEHERIHVPDTNYFYFNFYATSYLIKKRFLHFNSNRHKFNTSIDCNICGKTYLYNQVERCLRCMNEFYRTDLHDHILECHLEFQP